jgi:hypothetical protein
MWTLAFIEIIFPPIAEGLHYWYHCPAGSSQGILDLRRNFRVDPPQDDAIPFQLAELFGQDLGAHAGQLLLQL